MTGYSAGDRVRHAVWDEQVGTVRRVNGAGDVFVKWDNHLSEDQLDPDDVQPVNG